MSEMSEMTRYTMVPRDWVGEILFDWGRRGKRVRGCRWMPGTKGRRRLSFDDDWERDLVPVAVPCRRVVHRVRRLTDELWVVRRRRGYWWRNDRWLVPAEALAEVLRAEPELAGEGVPCWFVNRVKRTERGEA